MNENNSLISKRIVPLFKNISPKLEDKILIGLGAFFLCNILAFVYFANAFFNRPSLMDQMNSERTRAQDKAWQDKFDRIFEEAREDFQKLNEAVEEDRRRKNEKSERLKQEGEANFQKVQEELTKSHTLSERTVFTNEFDEVMKAYEREIEENRSYPKKELY